MRIKVNECFYAVNINFKDATVRNYYSSRASHCQKVKGNGLNDLTVITDVF